MDKTYDVKDRLCPICKNREALTAYAESLLARKPYTPGSVLDAGDQVLRETAKLVLRCIRKHQLMIQDLDPSGAAKLLASLRSLEFANAVFGEKAPPGAPEFLELLRAVILVNNVEKIAEACEFQPIAPHEDLVQQYRDSLDATRKLMATGLGIPAGVIKSGSASDEIADKQPETWTHKTLEALLSSVTVPAPAGACCEHSSVHLSTCVETRHSEGPRANFYFQLQWTAFDINTGKRSVQYGAKHMISRHAAKNEILQALLAAVLRASEHELRERFLYHGQPIYRPHHDPDALLTLTRQTEPQLRAPMPPDLSHMGVEKVS